MKLYIYIIGVMTLLFAKSHAATNGRTCYSREDSLTVVRLLQQAAQVGDKELPLFFARQFVGRPYVAHTLELFPDDERLIVNLRELDCTTLVENVTALTLCVRRHTATFAGFLDVLKRLRYRQGICNGYHSRLHYFSDWIEDNTQMGFVKEIQKTVPPFIALQKLNINYMSTHPEAYAALKKYPKYIKEIAAQEHALTGHVYRFIPKPEVKSTKELRNAVRDGDIIAITCKKPGLDIAHLGFALWQNDGLHLLNASMIHKKVVAETMTLGQYLAKHPSHTGIRVIRIL